MKIYRNWPAWAVVIALSFAYPLFGLADRTNNFKSYSGYTLDGNAFLQRSNPDEMAAIRWLEKASPGVVAEAVGGSYTAYARVSTHSGQPTVARVGTGHQQRQAIGLLKQCAPNRLGLSGLST